jgi:hypothetical protein
MQQGALAVRGLLKFCGRNFAAIIRVDRRAHCRIARIDSAHTHGVK